MSKISTILLFLFCYNNINAQIDSNFVVSQNGTNLIKLMVQESTTIKDISYRYNVSSELLALFNTYAVNDKILPNAIVTIPLTETNYYKNTSIGSNQGFVPLFYIADETEKLVDVSRKFLIPEATLYKWNNLKSQSLQFGAALQIGWLKDNQINFATNTTSKILQSENNLKYEPNRTFKDDIKSDYQNAKKKISKSVNQLGKSIKTITSSKSNQKQTTTILPDTIVGNPLVDNTAMIAIDSVPVKSNISFPKSSTKKLDLKKGFENTKNEIGKTFTNIGTSINKGIDKIGGTKNKSYQKEQVEKDARIKAESQKLKEQQETKKANLVIESNTKVADAEIVNNDTKLIEKPIENDMEIPKYQKDNEDAVLYEKKEKKSEEVKIVEPKPISTNNNSAQKINPKSGKAITFYAGAAGFHLAYTDYAPKGSKIIVENKKNGKKIEATVLGPLQKNGQDSEGIFILLSDTVKKDLSPSGENFMVEVYTANGQ
jgi:hypothetical protein